jgi:hypothetical protein
MHPSNAAAMNPAAKMLLEYAQQGFPIGCGRNWTKDEMQPAVTRGVEALEQVKDGCCKAVKWATIKHSPPPNLKISPIAAIPHKLQKYRMILDLAFALQVDCKPLQSVNDVQTRKHNTAHHTHTSQGT